MSPTSEGCCPPRIQLCYFPWALLPLHAWTMEPSGPFLHSSLPCASSSGVGAWAWAMEALSPSSGSDPLLWSYPMLPCWRCFQSLEPTADGTFSQARGSQAKALDSVRLRTPWCQSLVHPIAVSIVSSQAGWPGPVSPGKLFVYLQVLVLLKVPV